MRQETIIHRQDGSKIKIDVDIYIDFISGAKYRVAVWKCEPKKRTWINVHNRDDYQWRRLGPEERDKYVLNTYLKHVSNEEILTAKLSLWEKLKPI